MSITGRSTSSWATLPSRSRHGSNFSQRAELQCLHAHTSYADFKSILNRKGRRQAHRICAVFKLLRVLTDRGSEFCGNPERHEYELYLAVEDIDGARFRVKNGGQPE